ncbi:UNVERIFIED_CONTAM: Copia protein [Sesamum indicum]
MNTPARRGYSNFITFTDDHSRYGYVYLIRYKSEAFGRFKEFILKVENQTGCKIKILQSDRGGEYLTGEFMDYLKENGILSQLTPPRKPQLNSVVERRNRIIFDMGYAFETAAKLLNMAPSKTKYLRVWGSPAYVKRLVGNKLESKTSLCKFVRYPKETVGYYFYDPSMQKVFLWIADEIRYYLKSQVRYLSKIMQHHLNLSTRVSQPPDRYGFLWMTGQLDNDPRTCEEAISDIVSDKWLEALKSEMDLMDSNQVWILVDQPKGIKPVRCK